MTILDTVAKIKADIAALPAEYRGLILAEQNWASKHPILYALSILALGFILAFVFRAF